MLEPRLLAIYLIAVAVGVFLLPAWWMVAVAVAVQVGLWMGVGLGAAGLARQLRKLALFLCFILVCYSLVSTDPATDRWQSYSIPLLGWSIDINLTGALYGLTMVLRVIAVVLASQVIRAGDPRALARGLAKLGMPRIGALSIDAVLTLLGGRERGRGRGDGSGGGSGGRRSRLSRFWRRLKKLGSGDVSALIDPLFGHIDRAESHVADAAPDLDRKLARDIAIIAGIALTMLGIKALKMLPGLPFAPGHKGVILIPFYFAARALCRTRFAATLTGLTMGIAAFLLGDGRWGIFEVAKHVAPGLLIDLLYPVFMRRPATASVLSWSVLGTIAALGRFATVTAIALTVQAPAVVYAFLIPGLLIHGIFGALSGIVTAPLIRALLRRSEPSDDSS